MSIAELPSSAGALMRTPPQDLAAEQSVLGAMMLSKDAIADVVEVVRGHDFYRPAHELVFETTLDLYGRGEPADAVTVSAELQKRGELGRVGGAPYIHTLLQSVPTAANAGYYAKIVRETAILRRLIEAGTKIVQLGYNGDGDADDIVDAAQAEVYAVTDKRTSEDYLPLSAIMESALDEIEAIGSRGGEMVGVPTGFQDFDELTNGLHPGQMIVVAARPAVGKALALDTPLATPTGWTTMGEVRLGDRLLGADGRPTTVVAATDVMTGRPCYEVELSDGVVITADAEHGWATASRREGGSSAVRTTRELADTLWTESDGQPALDHSIPNTSALQLPEVRLPVPPYVLGAWLGARLTDSRSTGDTARVAQDAQDAEIAMYAESEFDPAVSVGDVMGQPLTPADMHVPAIYLRAGVAQRRALFAGLLDRLGRVTGSGCVQVPRMPSSLAEGVRDLAVGLGYECGLRVGADGEATVAFCAAEDVFRVEHKRLAHKDLRAARAGATGARAVIDVRRVPSVPVRCVEVDSPDHLYLAGRTMVPTHNSTLGLDIARSAAIKHSMATVVFSLEMSRNEITMRLLSAEARVPLHHMRTGKLTDDDWTRLARRMGEVSNAPLFIDDSPNMSMMEIRAKCRRLKQRNDLKLVVIDYLQLMSSGKRVESRQQEVSEFSRAIKLLAKELEVPVIAISQLNRGSEQRTDKKPQMSDLRESGCLPASTRVLRADTGAEVSIGELFASGARDVPVWSLDDSLRYRARTMTHVFSTGVREVFTVSLASGKQVRATANHPLLTYAGWRQVEGLAPGARVAVARHVPTPLDEPLPVTHERSFRLGIEDVAEVALLPKPEIAHFLWRLFRGHGLVDADDEGSGVIALHLASRRQVEDVSRLLLRFGISATVCNDVLRLVDTDDQRRFLQEIGQPGPDAARMLRRVQAETARRRTAPAMELPAWTEVERLLRRPTPTPTPSPDTGSLLVNVATVLAADDLEITASNDVLWDTVVSIESCGVEEVFDATVLGTHNFLADGVSVHNSIEQDADMVVLLHREELYERESPRAGEADFIVAKHRNGPTATITVAFQGHYSRFVDMAQS